MRTVRLRTHLRDGRTCIGGGVVVTAPAPASAVPTTAEAIIARTRRSANNTHSTTSTAHGHRLVSHTSRARTHRRTHQRWPAAELRLDNTRFSAQDDVETGMRANGKREIKRAPGVCVCRRGHKKYCDYTHARRTHTTLDDAGGA